MSLVGKCRPLRAALSFKSSNLVVTIASDSMPCVGGRLTALELALGQNWFHLAWVGIGWDRQDSSKSYGCRDEVLVQHFH